MPRPRAQETEKTEAEILREELAALRGELTSVKGELYQAKTEKTNAELAQLSEGERRLLAEESSADNAIASAENEAEALVGQQSGLMAEGKFAEAAALSRKIAAAENRVQNETMRKQYLAGEREKLKAMRETAAEQPRPQAPGQGMEPRLQQWIDSHPKFKSWQNQDGSVGYADKSYHDRAMAGHYAAQAQGVAVSSDEYFRIVEEHTGDRHPEQDEVYSQPQRGFGGQSFGDQGGEVDYTVKAPQSRAAGPGSMAAAPPSRSVPNAPRPGRAPDLSSEEREVADAIMSHIPNPAERYTRYAAHRDARRARGATH